MTRPAGAGPVVTRAAGRLVALLLLLSLGGCAPGGSASTTRELTVFAAASLRDAMDRIEDAYAGEAPEVRLVVSTDSSAALRTQIEQGAPADVFLSADTDNPARLVEAGLTDGSATTFAHNALAVVVPTDNPAEITSPSDLARPGVAIVAAGSGVPISRYVEQLMDRLGSLEGYPPDFEAGYERNVVSREDNVRAVLAKIALGEGDAGIVYQTDARASGDVVVIPIEAAANVVATYDAVVVRGPDAEAARAFLDWLTGPDGSAVLAELGFEPAS